MGVSIVLSSYKRPHLLRLGLSSIAAQDVKDVEVIVVNDGVNDDTEKICNKFAGKQKLKYIFSGQRNLSGDKPRVSGFALNIGVRAALYDKIILSCPEIYHLNNCIGLITAPLDNNPKALVIPQNMWFDEIGEYTTQLMIGQIPTTIRCELRDDHVQMPFLMGMWKKEFIDIGGYDEDFTGYASEDNDFVDRLKLNGCLFLRVPAQIVHLFHGRHKMSGTSWDNPAWAYNRNIYISRKDIIIRNQDREWGKNE